MGLAWVVAIAGLRFPPGTPAESPIDRGPNELGQRVTGSLELARLLRKLGISHPENLWKGSIDRALTSWPGPFIEDWSPLTLSMSGPGPPPPTGNHSLSCQTKPLHCRHPACNLPRGAHSSPPTTHIKAYYLLITIPLEDITFILFTYYCLILWLLLMANYLPVWQI